MASSKATRSSKNWLRHFLRPSWLAGIISIGFHGGMFAAGPTFSGLNFGNMAESDLIAENRQVPLVELTLEEQQRLPDFSQSFYSFDNFGALEPFDSLGGTEPEASITNESELFENRDRPTYTPSTPLRFSIESFESRTRPNTAPPPPPVEENNDSDQPSPSEEEPEASEDVLEEDDLESQNTAQDSPNDSETTPPEESRAADLEIRPVNPAEEAPPSSDNPDEIAANPPEAESNVEDRFQAYAYDTTNTDEENLEERLETWLEANETLTASSSITIPEPVTLPPIEYGQRICLPTPPHEGLIGALISSEGEILAEPEVLKSTGYLFINQQATEFINTLNFSSVDSLTAYQFEIVIDYDPEICVDLGQTNRSPQTSQDPAMPAEESIVQEADKNPDSEKPQD
ncbi:MAG: hypothetical protein F6K42_27610 [Leptolyngbya sp. SIO1D8]|nr:hypothetical protein [Leptolyngbya sp. SIO1D8]